MDSSLLKCNWLISKTILIKATDVIYFSYDKNVYLLPNTCNTQGTHH